MGFTAVVLSKLPLASVTLSSLMSSLPLSSLHSLSSVVNSHHREVCMKRGVGRDLESLIKEGFKEIDTVIEFP